MAPSMRAKTTKTAVPVDAFMKIMFEQVLTTLGQ